jgi:hypothetical protein
MASSATPKPSLTLAAPLSLSNGYPIGMPGPRVGAFSITDKAGVHYMACPACGSTGCPACGASGRVPTFPLVRAAFYQPGTYVPATPVPGHVNHVAQAIADFTLQIAGPRVGAISVKDKSGLPLPDLSSILLQEADDPTFASL